MHTPITYYGGKQQLSQTIVGMIPSHRLYCEPYFGGGAVFFAKGKSYLEVINDNNDNLITFYRVCQSEQGFEQLQKRLQSTLHSESEYKSARLIWNNPQDYDAIDIAWSVWLLTNMSFTGSPSGGWKWDNGKSGSHTGIMMDYNRNAFTKSLQKRLSRVQISCRDAVRVIRQRDTKDSFFYLDPPYPCTEQKHYKGFTFEEYEVLLQQLSNLKGRFILSCFSSELLDSYIRQNNWNCKEIEMSMSMGNLSNRKKKKELLVYNYELEPNLFDSNEI